MGKTNLMTDKTKPFFMGIMAIFFISLLLCSGTGIPAYGNGTLIDLTIISEIESNNRDTAISFRGARYGRGRYQISEICLKDYNQETRSNIAPEELFCPVVGYQVAHWYITRRIPQILRNWGIPITEETILWGYNAGVGRVRDGIKPVETVNYINKYRRLREKKEGALQ